MLCMTVGVGVMSIATNMAFLLLLVLVVVVVGLVV